MKTTQAAAEEAARKLYETDLASQSLGIEIVSVGPGRATVSMTVRKNMVNGHDTCHGGYIFLVADTAFAFACNSHGPATVAAGASIEFLAPAHTGDVLVANSEEEWQGGRTGLYVTRVCRDDGTLIAHFRGRSHRLRNAPAHKQEG